jgi:ADP-ribose pyrophosphatase
MSNRKTIYAGRVVTLEIENDKWEIIKHKAAVAILALEDGKMLMVKQYRPAIEAFTLEIPAGLIEDGEDVLTAAAREFAEECSLGGDLSVLTRFYSSPGFTDELLHLVHATNLHEAFGTPDEDEDITLEWIDPQDLISGALEGNIRTSSPGIAAAFYALNLAED